MTRNRDEWPAEEWYCHERTPLGERAAKNIALRERARGEQLTAYRCPFADSTRGHWHVGPPPSVADMEKVARRIRERRGNGPGVIKRKASK